jgi:branched-chain amino acid transport system substrate-binding protein
MRLGRFSIALSLATGLFAASAYASDPIRIGIPTSLSGAYAEIGEQVKRAVTYAVDEVNAKGGIRGRKVEAVFADDEANPDAGRRAAEKLVLGGARLLTGTISSAVGLAIAAQVENWDALYVSSINKTDRLTAADCNPRVFRANHSDGMDMAALSPWLKTRNEKDWAIIALDYAWGHGSAAGFEKAAAAAGMNIKGKFFVPLGAKDYAPYIQQIIGVKPQGLWVAISSRDAVNFAVQAKQFGLLPSVFMATHTIAGDQATIRTMGDIAEGMWGIVNYTSTIDNPGNKAFVAGWVKTFGKEPAIFEAQTYAAVKVLFDGIERAGSSEPGLVSKALESTSIDIPFYGPVTMRAEDHQLRGRRPRDL